MPWKSKKQERWGNSPAGHKALGDAGVAEWNAASKGKFKGKGTRARLNTAADKTFFGSKYSK